MFCINSQQHIDVLNDSVSDALLENKNKASPSSKILDKVVGVSNNSIKLNEKYEIPKNTTIFIERHSKNSTPEVFHVKKEIKNTPEREPYMIDISIENSNNESVAFGRCFIQKKPYEDKFLYISSVFVEGNNNLPTISNPNKHVGLGRVLIYEAMKFGNENNIKKTLLSPLNGSHGFYLKMGFFPQVEGRPNRMSENNSVEMSKHGKLNPDWIGNFEQSSFLNGDFRRSTWGGDTSLIYNEIQKQISNAWEVK
ncbi:GNAT family N-acetyltransferase [Pectobacterium carotovorum]|uniref:GNAT family N-acetyltransferase n=1 Tax=Pectobacterium carotovorum TaxID=554 RepID=A0A419AUP3_PECCA|nr:GNAT family N-acetyltransferase [Pectobacterium carotovorum]RJL50499.1 GNAT family N-acetyltransferase [Pectobacterium carotovorum]